MLKLESKLFYEVPILGVKLFSGSIFFRLKYIVVIVHFLFIQLLVILPKR